MASRGKMMVIGDKFDSPEETLPYILMYSLFVYCLILILF